MCFDGGLITGPLIVGGITSAVSAGLAATAAQQKNKAVADSMARNNAAAGQEIAQQGRVTALQLTRSSREAARVRGLIAVSGATRGVGVGGSVAALERNADVAQGLNDKTINTNRFGEERGTLAHLANTQAGLESQGSNAALSGLIGGVQGFSTGLQLGTGLESLGAFNSAGITVDPGEFVGTLPRVKGFVP